MPEVVVRQARALLEEARFHGISQVEFKYDARDDQYKLLEINGRAWSWIKLPAFSGVNLPLIQYYDLTNDPRLDAALASPQRDGFFLVRDALIVLNKLDSRTPHHRRPVARARPASAPCRTTAIRCSPPSTPPRCSPCGSPAGR